MTDIAYSMDQYRYNSGTTCMTPITTGTAKYLDWKIETETSPFYRDIIFDINANKNSNSEEQTLIANIPYYFKFAIPRDINYDFDISIKLLKDLSSFMYQETTTSYQFIKYISNRKISSKGTHNNLVVLYQIEGENAGQDIGINNHARTALQSYRFPGSNFIPTPIDEEDRIAIQTKNSGQFYEVLAPPIGYVYYENCLYHNRVNDIYWMFKDNTPENSPYKCKALKIVGLSYSRVNIEDTTNINPKNEGWYEYIDNVYVLTNDEIYQVDKNYYKISDSSSGWEYDENNEPTGVYKVPEDPFGTSLDGVYKNILIGTNDVILNWTWDSTVGTDIAYHHCIITPAENGFKYILLQLQRITEDSDILANAKVGSPQEMCENQPGSSGYGQPINGRMINLEQILDKKILPDGTEEKTIIQDTFKLYKLNELNSIGGPLSSSSRTIKRFGIWSHPELLMAINGEEIQIGQSGYYELNDFDTNSICIVADGPEDTFVLDYQYVQ